MSHTSTCERDEHIHGDLDDVQEVGSGTSPSKSSDKFPRPDRPRVSAGGSLELLEVRSALAATVLFVVAVLSRAVGAPGWMVALAYVACYLTGGWDPAREGLRALRDRRLDVDLLMIAAAVGAAAIGQVFDGALLIVIFATSGALESAAVKRTRDSVHSLLTLAPEQATRLLAGGNEQTVPAAALEVGDVVLVRPGERIGADGEVVAGISEVDQASITGEPLPVTKSVGDEVFAGTLNGVGMLHVRVDRPAGESVIARIAALVAQATATKARTQLFIERVEQRYSIGVVVATVAVFFGPLAFGAPLQETLLRAMTFMIVASPCAVVLATMPPLLSAIANAGRHGVLVKDAAVMERLGITTVVCFDKTGTLTQGTPQVNHVLPVADIDSDALLAVAAAAERPSEHPVARAIVAAAHDRGLAVPAVEGFRSQPGRGVTAVVDGHRVQVGSPDLLTHTGLDRCTIWSTVEEMQRQGQTVALTIVDKRPVGVIGLGDQSRSAARDAVSRVALLTGNQPVLLTGDSAAAAEHLAREVGIDDVRAGLLPEDKVGAVRALQAAGERVLVVGDGVNDAPALAAANLGAAMRGSDLALETADLVIVRDDLATLPAVIQLSRRARRVVVQNLVFAGLAIAALVSLDLAGRLPLPLGVAGHEGSTVFVGLNGLRLLADRAWRKG